MFGIAQARKLESTTQRKAPKSSEAARKTLGAAGPKGSEQDRDRAAAASFLSEAIGENYEKLRVRRLQRPAPNLIYE